MIWPHKTDDQIIKTAYAVYEEFVGRDDTLDLSEVAHQLQHYSEVSKEQAIRVLTRVRKEKMASGKYFPTYEEQFNEFKSWYPKVPLKPR